MRPFAATLAFLLAAGAARAQDAAPQTAQPTPAAEQAGAEQVVGLFLATCVHFHGDIQGLRNFIGQHSAPPMPARPGAMLLAGRTGQVFDVSYQDTHLALVSADDGSCDAVAEFADPDAVGRLLAQQFANMHLPLKQVDDSADPKRPGVRHQRWDATVGDLVLHITATTSATGAPQAALVLAPK